MNMPRVSECQIYKYGKVLNRAAFSKCDRYTAYWICKNMPWKNSDYILCYWILKGSEYASITQGSKYVTIWLNISEFSVIDRVLNIYHATQSARSI